MAAEFVLLVLHCLILFVSVFLCRDVGFSYFVWSVAVLLNIQPYVKAVGFFCASDCVLMLWAIILSIGFLFTPVQRCWFQLLC